MDSTSAYAPAVPSMEMLTSNGVHVLHVPLPQSRGSDSGTSSGSGSSDNSVAIATAVLIWTGEMVEQESLTSALNAAIDDIRLMLKYSKRFCNEQGNDDEASGRVHSIKCLRAEDAAACSSSSVGAASEEEVMMFWKTLGALSSEAGEEMIRKSGTTVASTLNLSDTKNVSTVRRGEGARAVEDNVVGEAVEKKDILCSAVGGSGGEGGEGGEGGDEKRHFPTLYLRTCRSKYELLSTYDDDDLETTNVVVLLASMELVYVCVGGQCVGDVEISGKGDEEVHAHMIDECQQGFFGSVDMSTLKVVIVREGVSEEWDNFMDAFAEGL